jgi:hypothetical protein
MRFGFFSTLLTIWLSVLIAVTIVVLHPYPRWKTTRIEHQGELDKTVWFNEDGSECGEVWASPDSQEWYVNRYDGAEFGHYVVNKRVAYKQVEWWCRP